MDEININSKNLLMKLSKKVTNIPDNQTLKELYKWSYNDKFIKCYGFYDGDEIFINKHKLPFGGVSTFLEEDSSIINLYSDIFLLLFDKNDNLCNFNISDYSVYYDLYNNINNTDSSDSDIENDNDNLINDNLNSDNENNLIDEYSDDEYIIYSDEEELLDIDNNEY